MTKAFLRPGRPLDLKLSVHGLRRPLLTLLLIGGAVGLLAAICDLFVFRAFLSESYLRVIAEVPAAARIVVVATKALGEEIVFRLILMSLLVWAASLLWRPTDATYWCAAVLAQVANIALQGPVPVTPAMTLYVGLRFLLPGVVWGYLYWRHGFASAVIAHMSAHVVLQPALSWLPSAPQ